MNEVFEYKGYTGSIQTSIEDECLFGKILFINDIVTYEAESLKDLKKEFASAVDDYLDTCRELGKEPDRSFKGSFNVRIDKDLHRKAALKALTEDASLNELVSKAIEFYLQKPASPIVEHHNHHNHHHYHSEQSIIPFTYSPGGDEWTAKHSWARQSH